MKPVDFQNILVALIGVAIIVGFGARPSLFSWSMFRRRENSEAKSTYQMEVKTPQSNVSEEVARLQKSVSEIESKVSDLHAFKGIIEQEPLSRLADVEKKLKQIETTVGNLAITKTIVEEQKTEHKAKTEEEKTRE